MGARAEPSRPHPEALLAQASREDRGRLKIYLGMAPGVGKTYAMLEGAQRLKAQGIDAIVGIVETHGRQETEALVTGLEVLPRKQNRYRGLLITEFDIDGALRRRPGLLLVDELAHTNVEGSRHPKRWQDVDELIKAGIDVHTTLNIQHLEGLNDIVARITGVRVLETVPDRVLEQANEVELVDLPPEELLARLEEGKVYVADLAARAREGFFKPGNLTALRELALRRTAERVDDQMVGYMREHAIEGPWQAGERIMVCVGPDGLGPAIVRAGRRIADQLKAPWVVVYVERAVKDEAAEKMVSEAIGLAERLQARTERLTGFDIPAEILHYARRNNITQVVVGRSRASFLRELLRRSLVHELVRKSEGIAIHVVTQPTGKRKLQWPELPAAYGVIAGAGAVAAVVLLALAVPALQTLPNVSMLFLAAVLLTALWQGLGSGLLAAVLSFLAYNFFFTEPYFTFRAAHWHDVVALVVFLIVAATTGTLAGRVRDQARITRSRVAALQTLYTFSRRLGAAKISDELLHAVVLQVHRLSGLPTMMLLPLGDKLEIRYAWPPSDLLDDVSMGAARWSFQHLEPAGTGTGTLPSAGWHFRPLGTLNRAVGVLGIETRGAVLPTELVPTLDAMLDQSAVALERISFGEEATRSAAAAETERFRNALLTSISHDLRTPLTSILGSVTALRRTETSYTTKAADELLATIQEEAERLDGFVANLLDITRLEAGTLDVKREWLVIPEVAESAIRRMKSQVEGLAIVRDLSPDLPLVRADFVLLETVLINLIENATKHAIGASRIEIRAEAEKGTLFLTVTDDGDGIPPDQLMHIFDKFYRIKRKDRTVAGTGLGLAISKGMVEILGGKISVHSPVSSGRGTRFEIRFPVEVQPKLQTLHEVDNQ